MIDLALDVWTAGTEGLRQIRIDLGLILLLVIASK